MIFYSKVKSSKKIDIYLQVLKAFKRIFVLSDYD